MSKKDCLAMEKMNCSKQAIDAYYKVVLPWRPRAPLSQNNCVVSGSKLLPLKGKKIKPPLFLTTTLMSQTIIFSKTMLAKSKNQNSP